MMGLNIEENFPSWGAFESKKSVDIR